MRFLLKIICLCVFNLSAMQLQAKDNMDLFDNNFLVKDIVIVSSQSCNKEISDDFKSFAHEKLIDIFKVGKEDIIKQEHGDYASIIMPFKVTRLEFEKFIKKENTLEKYDQYRLIVLALHTYLENHNSCLLGFGVLPEVWDGNNWLRIVSNKDLEISMMSDYMDQKHRK